MSIQNASPSLILSYAPVATTAEERAAAKRRNEAIDVIRLIAAAGIVYIHAGRYPALAGSRNLFRFAVPFYLFASFYFQSLSLRKKTDRTLLQYAWGRVKRLYFPFLAWSAIYLIARDIKRHFSPQHQEVVKLVPGLLWKGIEYHLWFLPFLLASSLLLAVIFWTTLRFDRRWRWPLIIAVIAAGFAFAYIPMPGWNEVFDNPTYAYVQDWRALPAMCWALAFAWFMTMGPTVYSVSFATGFAGIALTIYCSVRQAVHVKIELVPRALSGLGAMLAALAPWHGKWVPILARYGRYSYGIYLCHVLIAEFVRAGASHLHMPDSPSLDMVNFLFTLLGSILLVLALGRSPRTAWLNG